MDSLLPHVASEEVWHCSQAAEWRQSLLGNLSRFSELLRWLNNHTGVTQGDTPSPPTASIHCKSIFFPFLFLYCLPSLESSLSHCGVMFEPV